MKVTGLKVQGLRFMGYGLWFMMYGSRLIVYGSWLIVWSWKVEDWGFDISAKGLARANLQGSIVKGLGLGLRIQI